jgi:hypothetical protein
MKYLGDYASQATVDLTFTTLNGGGALVQLSGTPAVSVYKANNITQTTTGVTLTVDFDSLTGLNHVRIETTDAFYVTGEDYHVVITSGTVNGVSVVGYRIAEFSIENRVANTRAEDIQSRLPAALTADGNIKADTLRVGGTLQTAGDLSAQIDAVDNFLDTEIAAIEAAVATAQADLDIITGADGVNLLSATQASIDAVEAAAGDIQGRLLGLVLHTATIGPTANDTTHIHLDGLSYGNDELIGRVVVIYDDSADEFHVRRIDDWFDTGDLALVGALPFTPEASVDKYFLLSRSATEITVDEIAEDVSGIQMTLTTISGKIGNPTDFGSGLLTLADNLRDLADDGTATFNRATHSLQAIRDRGDAAWITATGFSTLDAAGAQAAAEAALAAYAAVATTDLPANFADLAIAVTTGRVTVGTNADKTDYSISGTIQTLDALDTAQDVEHDATQAAIAALDTDLGTLTVSVADLPTNSELATALASADDAVLAAVAALNNLSAAQVNAEADAALVAALAEGYRADQATGSVRDLLYEINAHLSEAAISGTTKTINKIDGSTPAMEFTLDDATNPSTITRAS